MANIKAQATGLWSAGATWSGGVPPGVNDVGYSNTFTVTIDQDITCLAITNATNTGITAGGGFIITSIPGGGRTLNCDIGVISSSGNTGNILDISVSGTLNITGSIQLPASGTGSYNINIAATATGLILNTGGIIASSGAASWGGINIRTTATITVTGNCTIGSQQLPNINWTSGASVIINIIGNITAGASASSPITLSSTAVTLNITGNILAATASVILLSTGTHTVTIVGNVTAGAAVCISSTGASIIDVVGTITASSASAAIDSTSNSGVIRISGSLVTGPNNKLAIYAPKWVVKASQNISFIAKDDSTSPTGVNVTLANYATDTPAPSNVRRGVQYGQSSSLTGTLDMPTSEQVLVGVPVDATVGEAGINADPMETPL